MWCCVVCLGWVWWVWVWVVVFMCLFLVFLGVFVGGWVAVL